MSWIEAASIGTALFIFALRVIEMTLGTLRVLMVVRGQKLLAWVLGFLASLTYVLAMGLVFANLNSWQNLLAYAAGFATGNVLGMLLEDRLALGYVNFQIVSSCQGLALAARLRALGYAVTEVPARGKDGTVTLLECNVLRKHGETVKRCVQEVDETAFITAENVHSVMRGFWGNKTGR